MEKEYPDFIFPEGNLFYGDARKEFKKVEAYVNNRFKNVSELLDFLHHVKNVYDFSLDLKTSLNTFLLGEENELKKISGDLQTMIQNIEAKKKGKLYNLKKSKTKRKASKPIINAQIENESEENNFIKSTIEEQLEGFKNLMIDKNYKILVNALLLYIKKGTFPKIKVEIGVNKVNKKKFGWALNQIYRKCKNDNSDLPIDYLRFAKTNISIFKNVDFSKSNYLESNLYKYFTTKTQ